MILLKSAANPVEKEISRNSKPYLIAEFGLNHNRDLGLAKRMADAAARCGVDAVKLQSYTTSDFINIEFENVRGLYDIFAGLELDEEFHLALREHVVSCGMAFCSTPLTLDWVARLEALQVPFFKIASGDINNTGLVAAACNTRKPVLVSTGAASEQEIRRALAQLHAASAAFALLHCVSLYPTPPEKANISRLQRLAELAPAADFPLGFSDHTQGTQAAFAAVAAGATLIEKHFTLDRNLPGPDQQMSADPQEMHALRAQIDLAHAIRGQAANADCQAEETRSDYYGKRSLYTINGRTLAMRPRHPDFPLP